MTLGDLSQIWSNMSVHILWQCDERTFRGLGDYLERTFGVRKGQWGQALATLK